MAKLLLIDGNAIIHRAYHALPPLTNSKGEVVNAVYGFFSMLLNVLQDQKPEYLVVCFDRPGPNFRQELFAGYQQHRPKLADDFVPQIILVHELLEKMKVAVFELDGYEADDLIGTIAVKAIRNTENRIQKTDTGKTEKTEDVESDHSVASVSSGIRPLSSVLYPLEVVILTGDRDMLQLVNGHVKILMPLVGITKTALMGSREVEEKYGVKPSQFIDYKALIGDASDGYPGVAGIGPKTASSLLQKYSTFENLYDHVKELPEKIGLKLTADAKQAELAKKLAAIITDAPVQFDISKCLCADFDLNGIYSAFEEQGFKSLLARYDKVFGSAKKKESEEIKKTDKKDGGQMGLF